MKSSAFADSGGRHGGPFSDRAVANSTNIHLSSVVSHWKPWNRFNCHDMRIRAHFCDFQHLVHVSFCTHVRTCVTVLAQQAMLALVNGWGKLATESPHPPPFCLSLANSEFHEQISSEVELIIFIHQNYFVNYTIFRPARMGHKVKCGQSSKYYYFVYRTNCPTSKYIDPGATSFLLNTPSRSQTQRKAPPHRRPSNTLPYHFSSIPPRLDCKAFEQLHLVSLKVK